MILENGPIYTLDPRLPRVRALSVAGPLVVGGVDVREGDADTVGHERIDLEGRCVLPGFSDSHLHFKSWALARTELDLIGCDSLAEALAAVAQSDGDGWIRGRGWRDARWPDGPPTAAALDAVTGERPAALTAHDGHTLWVNSAALRATSMEHPTGILHEREAWAFPLPEPAPLEVSRAVRAAMADANAKGVTAVHDFEFDGGRDLWQRLDGDRRLTLRVDMGLPAEELAAVRTLELRSGFGSELLRVGPVKVFMDGTLGSETAWMLDGSGDILTSENELCEIVIEAAAGGLDVAVHAIGDGANRAALNAFEATRERWEASLMRPRIEHVQCLADDDLPRFADLDVIASVQPSHATSDRDVADRLWGDRGRRAHIAPATCSRPEPTSCSGQTLRSSRSHRWPASTRPSTAPPIPATRGIQTSGSRLPTRCSASRPRVPTRSVRSVGAGSCCPATRPIWWYWTPTSSPSRSGSPKLGSKPRCSPDAGSTTPRPGERQPPALSFVHAPPVGLSRHVMKTLATAL